MAPTREEALTILHAYRERYLSLTPEGNFDRSIWACLNIEEASVEHNSAKALFSITIPPAFSNHLGTVHGGAMATLFDGVTSAALALLSRKDFWDGREVSRDIQVKFFRPILFGEVITAESEVVHVGQRLAAIKGELRRKSDGALLASCVHEKFSPFAKPKL